METLNDPCYTTLLLTRILPSSHKGAVILNDSCHLVSLSGWADIKITIAYKQQKFVSQTSSG